MELQISLFGAVGIAGAVNEGTPHDNTFVRFHCIGQHIGTFGMGAVEVARAGLPFGIGFHEEAAEVGDEVVDFFCFVLPPGDNFFVQRVGSRKTAQLHGGSEVDGEIHTDAVWAEYICQCFYFLQIFGGKDL